jgi:hypothetical protein
VLTRLAPCMQTCRNRRARQVGFESAGRDFFLRWAPLAPGSRDNTCQHAGPCLEFSYSYPPDRIGPNRVGRLRRCPNSDISYKLMLHLQMLKKSAIFKKNSPRKRQKSRRPSYAGVNWHREENYASSITSVYFLHRKIPSSFLYVKWRISYRKPQMELEFYRGLFLEKF